jgi:orotidine-5'-phosphate decarboxylase
MVGSRNSAATSQDPRVIVALDYDNAAAALAFADAVRPTDCRLKVGLELFTIAGAPLVEKLIERGFDIFLDLKFHDIPNTVAQACRATAQMGVWMMNVHTLGGLNMMCAARDAIDSCQHKPIVIGVTILTSHNQEDIQQVGLMGSPAERVSGLASLAEQAGLDGVVCSPHEAASLKASRVESFLLVTPGVRPTGSDGGDQRRVMTPAEAWKQGSDYLVIGRPITRAADPVAVLEEINNSLMG